MALSSNPKTNSFSKSREIRGGRLLLAALLFGIFCLAWITSARASLIESAHASLIESAHASSAIVATDLPDLVEKILPGVANISSIKIEKTMAYGMDEYFRLWQVPKEHPQTSMGSGFVLSKDGYVITNNHVVEGADEVNVIFMNRKSYKARIIGRDDKLDVALLRIRDKDGKVPPDLVPLPMSDATKVRIAEPVFAVGNPFGLGHTVTSGIISAKNRTIGVGPLDNFLQTDASINPGNSGGPLFNFKGEVIGINTVIFSRAGQSAGLGFAIPINAVRDVLDDLKKFGRVPRPWLGILGQPINEAIQAYYSLPVDHGVILANLVSDGPSARAGLRVGDVLLLVNGVAVKENADVERELYKKKPTDTVSLKLLRKGKMIQVKVKLAELPKLDRLPQGII
jgi:serine protease Do